MKQSRPEKNASAKSSTSSSSAQSGSSGGPKEHLKRGSFEAGEAALAPDSEKRNAEVAGAGSNAAFDPERPITTQGVHVYSTLDLPRGELGVASEVGLSASVYSPLLSRHFSDPALVERLQAQSPFERSKLVESTIRRERGVVRTSPAPLAQRTFWPESPDERFDDAARAAFASISATALSGFAATAFNGSSLLAGAPLGNDVPFAKVELWPRQLPQDPTRFPIVVTLDSLQNATPGLKEVKVHALGKTTREAYMSGADVFAAAQQQAHDALASEGFCKALREAIAEHAKGPFDYRSIALLDREAMLAVVRAVPGGESVVEIERFMSRFDRSLLPEGATDLSEHFQGDGSVAVTSGNADALYALANRVGDVSLAEIIESAQPARGDAKAGAAPTNRAATATRRAVVVIPPPSADQGPALCAAAAASALGFEVERVELPRESENVSNLGPQAAARSKDIWAADCRARQGAATLAMLSGLAPGDEAMVYTGEHSPHLMTMVASQARSRGIHAAYFSAGSANDDSELAALADPGDVGRAANVPTLPSVPVMPDDKPEVLREVFVANALAAHVSSKIPGRVLGVTNTFRATGLIASRVFGPGGPLSGQLTSLEDAQMISLSEIGERFSRIHTALLRFIDDLRLGLGVQDDAAREDGALAVYTSSDSEAVPDHKSWTDKVLASDSTLDEGVAKTAADASAGFNAQRLVQDGKKADGARYALVVGNSMPLPHLSGAIRDAKGVASRRAGEGFEVTHLEDLKGNELSREVRSFFGEAKKGERFDFYYAGHGGTDGLIGVDSAVVGSGVIAANVSRATRIGAEVTTTVDACHAGKLPIAAASALVGKDHLPAMASRSDDDASIQELAQLANALRDQYLIVSGGAAVDASEMTMIGSRLAALAKLDTMALRAADQNGKSAATPTQLAELHAKICREIEGQRGEAKKKAWLSGDVPR